MSASDQMRAMLAQLMGTNCEGEKKSKYDVKFDDRSVCKSFLLGCCPHDILSATRMDLGECSKIHDIALVADFNNASKTRDYFYDVDAFEHLQSFVAECDRKMEQSKKRLKETQEELSEEAAAKVNAIHAFGEQIGTKLARAEELGAEGSVEESLKLMEEVEALKKQKAEAEMDYRNTMPASNYQQQKLRVCEVCSAFLGIHDNDRRLADHFGGKLHVGFITLRSKLAELQQTMDERRANRERERNERKRDSPPRSTSRKRSPSPSERRQRDNIREQRQDDGRRDDSRRDDSRRDDSRRDDSRRDDSRRDDSRRDDSRREDSRRDDSRRDNGRESRRERERDRSRERRRHDRDDSRERRRRSRSRSQSRRSQSHRSSSKHSSRRSRSRSRGSRSRRSRSGSRHQRDD